MAAAAGEIMPGVALSCEFDVVEAMDHERKQIVQCIKALQRMRQPENTRQKARKEAKEAKTQRRFAQEMKESVRVGPGVEGCDWAVQ